MNKTTFTIICFSLVFTIQLLAQPIVLYTGLSNTAPSPNNSRFDLASVGGFKQARFQSNQSAAASSLGWAFHIGSPASPDYSTNWRPYTGGNTVSANTFIPTSFANGARYNSGGGGADGLLPAITNGNYYTFNVSNNMSVDNTMALLETNYNPVSITSVSQNPMGDSVLTSQAPIVTITTSSPPSIGEFIYVRYSTDAFTTSTILPLTISGNIGNATLPTQVAGTAVNYYIFSSNKTAASIASDVVTYGQAAYDMATLNLSNNGGTNYKYTVVAKNILVTSTGGTKTSLSYTTLFGAINAINNNTIHTGTINCYVNSGHTETAPVGGYSITATGSITNPIKFTKVGTGTNPTFTANSGLVSGTLTDAIFKIIGGDYITIDGFTMQENSNTTTAAGSNNMTEWGVALLYATTTNGAQNCTIQNCSISLNRIYQNSFGIYSNSTHSSNTISTGGTATTLAGGNSGLKIYSNTISNVNHGIFVVGPENVDDFNTGIDIGGTSNNTANTISNFGNTATFSNFANKSATINGILVKNSIGFNISNNSITVPTMNITSGTTLNGIQIPAASTNNPVANPYSNYIQNNTISLNSDLAGLILNGINYIGSGSVNFNATLYMTGNNCNNFSFTNSTPTAATNFYIMTAPFLKAYIGNNQASFASNICGSGGNVVFINHNNTIPENGIDSIYNNTMAGFTKSGSGGNITGFSATTGISPNSTHCFIVNNTVSNININNPTINNSYFFGINNNDGTGTSSPVKIFRTNNFSNVDLGTNVGNITGISISHIQGSGTSTNTSLPTSSEISGNNLSNYITSGLSLTGLSIGGSYGNTTGSVNVFDNGINTYTANGSTSTVNGIISSNPSANINIRNHTIYSFNNSGLATNGISILNATATNVFKNKIYDISSSSNNSTALVTGIEVTGGTEINLYNNIIGDIKNNVSTNNDGVRGLSINSVAALSTINAFYNTIYLTGSGGTNFGSSGVFHTTNASATTANLTLRNNIIVNNTTANGTGVAAAYRRSSTTLANYGSTSNNNLFYNGIPSSKNLIFSDGTNSSQTLSIFKSIVNPRDNVSQSENPVWQSSTATDVNYLKYNETIPTTIESGAANITNYTNDYANTTRQGNAGSTSTGTAPDIGAYELNGLPVVVCSGTPSSTSIVGVNGLCSGQSTLLSLNQVYYEVGITYQWAFSTSIGGPFTSILGTAATQNTGALASTTYYICTVTCANSGLTFITPVKTIVVNPLPTINVSPSSALLCQPNATPISLTASGVSQYTWSPSIGLSSTTGSNVSANPGLSTTYTVTGTDSNGCTNTGSANITVNTKPFVGFVSATPSTICSGDTSRLFVEAYKATEINNYLFTTSTGATLDPMMGATTVVSSNSDDAPMNTSSGANTVAGASVPLPFSFNYNNNFYTHYSASPDGWLSFANSSTSATSDFDNKVLSATNNPKLYALWDDLATGTDGGVKTLTTGVAPNRIFKINWAVTIPRNTSASANSNFQVWLYEATSKIEFKYGTLGVIGTSNGGASIGLTGSPTLYKSVINTTTNIASSTAFSNAISTSPSSGRMFTFTPSTTGINYLWSPTNFLSTGQEILQNPLASNVTITSVYTADVTANGCTVTSLPDSIKVLPTSSASSMATACNSYIWSGTTYTSSGTYMKTFSNAAGCDSVHTLTLTINNTKRDTFVEIRCPYDTILIWNGLSILTAGYYSDTLMAASGCDSIVTLKAEFNPLPTLIVNFTSAPIHICKSAPITLDASASIGLNRVIVWLKGDDEFIQAEDTLVVSEPGVYYAKVKAQGCVAVSDTVEIFVTGDTVKITGNSGTGSLRKAIECALAGDTIKIDTLLGTINLTQSLNIDKNLTIGNDSISKIINVNFSGIPAGNYGLNIAPSVQVTLRNLEILQSNNSLQLPLIKVEGNLKVKNVKTSQ